MVGSLWLLQWVVPYLWLIDSTNWTRQVIKKKKEGREWEDVKIQRVDVGIIEEDVGVNMT